MTEKEWSDAKTKYVTSDLSYRQIAEIYGVSCELIRKRGAKDKWVEARNNFYTDVTQKSLDKSAQKEVKKLERVVTAADRLLDKIEAAIEELDRQIVKQSKKVKIVEYKNRERPDKPTKETVTECESIEAVETIIDRDGLKAIAQALLAVKDIQGLKSERDIKEQDARIDKLKKDADRDADEAKQITVRIEGGGEWSQ